MSEMATKFDNPVARNITDVIFSSDEEDSLENNLRIDGDLNTIRPGMKRKKKIFRILSHLSLMIFLSKFDPSLRLVRLLAVKTEGLLPAFMFAL